MPEKFRDPELAAKIKSGEVKKDPTITKEGYQENPELNYSELSQYKRNLKMFEKSGKRVLYPPTKKMYQYIRDVCIDKVKNHPQYPKYNWKPKIVDVGCGGGFGTYILSHEADFVWGIDIDESNIRWCNVVFAKNKNGIYYSSQIAFDVMDITDEPRELMQFDIIACIEVIEHVYDYQKALDFLKRLCKTGKNNAELSHPDATLVYISSPNRNFPRIGKEKPKNIHHVREWTAAELYKILTENFRHVTLMDYKGNLQDLDTKTSVLLFKCEVPIYGGKKE